jgi:hypothetical protein
MAVNGHFRYFVEDSPAPMALHSFKTSVVNGDIHVTAHAESTLKQNLARQSTLLDGGAYSLGPGVVIVGGGSGAFHAVESLRGVSFICVLRELRCSILVHIPSLARVSRLHRDPFERDIYPH